MTNWTKEMHLTALKRLKAEITSKDYDLLLKEISKEIGVTVLSLKAAIQNYKFAAIGVGLSNVSKDQEKAVEEYIQEYGKSLFNIL